MRCSQAEHLLSLNLDGRLASSQRRTLSDHLGECARCREIDHELSAARQLALSLPVQRVSQGFREELWQRIRAGEGRGRELLVAHVVVVRPHHHVALGQGRIRATHDGDDVAREARLHHVVFRVHFD